MANLLLIVIMLLCTTIALFIISVVTLVEVRFIHKIKKCKHPCCTCEYAKICHNGYKDAEHEVIK